MDAGGGAAGAALVKSTKEETKLNDDGEGEEGEKVEGEGENENNEEEEQEEEKEEESSDQMALMNFFR